VIKLGSEYLMNNLNCSNCISIRRYSEEQSLKDLKFASYKYILDNFEQIVQSDELLNELTRSELNDLFESSYLNVTCEEVVYEALMRWIHLNKDTFHQDSLSDSFSSVLSKDSTRSDSKYDALSNLLGDLLAKVKLPLLKASYLTKQIENNSLISSNIKCKLFIVSILYLT
jgi:hypothetical protein